MPCHTFRSADGKVSGIVCSRGPRSRPKKCSGCGKLTADLLCDFPVGPGKTCDRSICKACSRHVGPDRDYCLTHPTEDR